MPAAVLGVTNPAEWDANGWISDNAPHLAHDLMTAVAYQACTDV